MICEVGKKKSTLLGREETRVLCMLSTHTYTLLPAMGKLLRLSGPSFPDSKVKRLNWGSRRPARKTAVQRQQSGLRQMKGALCPLNPSNALQGLGFKVYMFTWKGKRATQRGPHQTPPLSTKCRLVKLQWLAVPGGQEPTVPHSASLQGVQKPDSEKPKPQRPGFPIPSGTCPAS